MMASRAACAARAVDGGRCGGARRRGAARAEARGAARVSARASSGTAEARSDAETSARGDALAQTASVGADVKAFTVPATLVAGAPARVFVNVDASGALREASGVTALGGCNGWRCGAFERSMTRVSGTPWMYADIDVDENAYEMTYVFKNDGTSAYENNDSRDFTAAVEHGPTPEEFAEILKLLAIDERARAEANAEVDREMSMTSSDVGAGVTLEKYGRTIVKTPNGEPLSSGSKTQVFWNKAQNPIGGADATSLIMHVGYNEWIRGVEEKFTMRRASGEAQDENNDWWVCDIPVSPTASVLNFVISDADEQSWDNNDKENFRVAVKNVADEDVWAVIRELRFEEKRAAALRAINEEKERLARRAKEAAKAKQIAIEVGLKQQAFIIYTEPKVPQAGQPLKVFYNKNNTHLNWSQDIHMTGGFNRWTHVGAGEPLKMTPPKEGEEFYTAVVPSVPNDSWMVDFVFSSGIGEGAQYDNRGGRDYHLPVSGGNAKKPPLHVVHIAVEMAPIAKVGGLADVVTAISRAIQDNGHQVEIILPKYQFFNNSVLLGGREYETHFDWGGTTIRVEKCIVEGLQCFFVEPQNNMFSTDSVYGRNDDGERFNFFCNAALEFLNRTARQPDILHCHDWSSAEVARAYWQHYHHNGMHKPKVAFTIHNMNYGQAKLSEAVHHSQMTTTVSRSYAGEVSGSSVVNGNLQKFYGVRNGIDPDIWDPEIDNFLPMKYNAETCVQGKAAARAELRSRLGMSGWDDKPIVGVVSRLTAQKGVHLIKHAAHHTLARGGQFVLLGSAPDPKIQGEFNGLANSLSGDDSGFFFAFDEPLSHLMYAGCDIILVPSMFEPCGLTQMISMRYGAVPVVRATGGLRDTVFDVDNEKERAAWEIAGSSDWKTDGDVTNGFSFEGTDEGSLDYALDRCLDAFYNDREWFRSLQKRDMLQDWSWNKPALEYEELYFKCIGQ
jgi:starch synthase